MATVIDDRSWAERRGYCIEETRFCRCDECVAYREHAKGRAWEGVTEDERRVASDLHDREDGVGDARRLIGARGDARRKLRAHAPEMAEAILDMASEAHAAREAYGYDIAPSDKVCERLEAVAEKLRAIDNTNDRSK